QDDHVAVGEVLGATGTDGGGVLVDEPLLGGRIGVAHDQAATAADEVPGDGASHRAETDMAHGPESHLAHASSSVVSSACSGPSSSTRTGCTTRIAAMPAGHPTYAVACTTVSEISFRDNPFRIPVRTWVASSLC